MRGRLSLDDLLEDWLHLELLTGEGTQLDGLGCRCDCSLGDRLSLGDGCDTVDGEVWHLDLWLERALDELRLGRYDHLLGEWGHRKRLRGRDELLLLNAGSLEGERLDGATLRCASLHWGRLGCGGRQKLHLGRLRDQLDGLEGSDGCSLGLRSLEHLDGLLWCLGRLGAEGDLADLEAALLSGRSGAALGGGLSLGAHLGSLLLLHGGHMLHLLLFGRLRLAVVLLGGGLLLVLLLHLNLLGHLHDRLRSGWRLWLNGSEVGHRNGLRGRNEELLLRYDNLLDRLDGLRLAHLHNLLLDGRRRRWLELHLALGGLELGHRKWREHLMLGLGSRLDEDLLLWLLHHRGLGGRDGREAGHQLSLRDLLLLVLLLVLLLDYLDIGLLSLLVMNLLVDLLLGLIVQVYEVLLLLEVLGVVVCVRQRGATTGSGWNLLLLLVLDWLVLLVVDLLWLAGSSGLQERVSG